MEFVDQLIKALNHLLVVFFASFQPDNLALIFWSTQLVVLQISIHLDAITRDGVAESNVKNGIEY